MLGKQKVLITGAAGTIGQLLTKRLKDRYDLVLTDKKAPKETFDFPFQKSDIAQYNLVESLFQTFSDIHTVIHLAADIRISAPWESLLPNNIVGTYNVFEAARIAGCKRIIFASSINAVDGYPSDVQVHTNTSVAPANLYGASKVWGEAIGRFYADYKDMAVHCLRIGWVTPHDGEHLKNEAKRELLYMAVTHRDLLKLFESCLESDLNFGIWHGISDNLFKRLDISDTKDRLGYDPSDDGFVLSGKISSPEDF